MMTDGFIDQAVIARNKRVSSGSAERKLAEQLIKSALRQHWQLHRESGPGARLDVWVIGRPSWSAREPSEPIDDICELETRADYRLVILGDDVSHPPSIGGWADWVYAAGLRLKKKHTSRNRFQSAAANLLGLMHDYVESTGSTPAPVLERLDLPFVHATTHALSRDSDERYRIQQYENI